MELDVQKKELDVQKMELDKKNKEIEKKEKQNKLLIELLKKEGHDEKKINDILKNIK